MVLTVITNTCVKSGLVTVQKQNEMHRIFSILETEQIIIISRK